MRIAFVTETFPPEINGVALTVERSVTHLREHGHSVELIRPRQADERCGAACDEWRVPGWPIPVYPELRFGFARPGALARRFAAARTELVHVATQGPLGWAAVRAGRRLALAVTSDYRTNFHQYSHYYGVGWMAPAIGAYLRRFHNGTRRSFVPTWQKRRELLAAGFERVEVVGRGVDLERFSPAKRDPGLRAHWCSGPGPVLLHVGRLAPEKNVRLALQAFRCAHQFVPSARMVVVGDGPLRRQLEHEFPEARFVGAQHGDALAAHYASAAIFLFPSLSETFGNVTLEALASGLPVVAFDLAAASEHITDRINGRVVAPGDEQAFVVATICLMSSQPSDLEPMRCAARRAAQCADWDSVLGRFEAQLLDTADAHQQRGSRVACVA